MQRLECPKDAHHPLVWLLTKRIENEKLISPILHASAIARLGHALPAALSAESGCSEPMRTERYGFCGTFRYRITDVLEHILNHAGRWWLFRARSALRNSFWFSLRDEGEALDGIVVITAYNWTMRVCTGRCVCVLIVGELLLLLETEGCVVASFYHQGASTTRY